MENQTNFSSSVASLGLPFHVELWAIQNSQDPALRAFCEMPVNVAQQRIIQYHQHCTSSAAPAPAVSVELPPMKVRQPVAFDTLSMMKQGVICLFLVWILTIGALMPFFVPFIIMSIVLVVGGVSVACFVDVSLIRDS